MIDGLVDPTFHLDIVADTSVDTVPEPFFDLAHICSGWVTLPLTPHGTKLVKCGSSFVHKTIGPADIPLHLLSAAEISHIPDIGMG